MQQATDLHQSARSGWLTRLGTRITRRTGSVPLLGQVVLGSAGLAILVAAAFAVLLVAMSDLRTSTNAQAHSKDVSTATLELERVVNELEESLRGYVISGNHRFLASWQQARRALPASLDRVEKLVA